MKTTVPLILASGSPRRRELLQNMGYDFVVRTRPVEEILPENADPVAIAEGLAQQKAGACLDWSQDHLVLTADTVVAIEGKLLGKAEDRSEALSMLQSLSGKINQVITGICLLHKGAFQLSHELTEVKFADLSQEQMEYYVDRYQPYDKAGAYGIQEWIGMTGIEWIKGDYYNVVGLPTRKVYKLLAPYC